MTTDYSKMTNAEVYNSAKDTLYGSAEMKAIYAVINKRGFESVRELGWAIQVDHLMADLEAARAEAQRLREQRDKLVASLRGVLDSPTYMPDDPSIGICWTPSRPRTPAHREATVKDDTKHRIIWADDLTGFSDRELYHGLTHMLKHSHSWARVWKELHIRGYKNGKQLELEMTKRECDEARVRIAVLEAENARLRDALRPFADAWKLNELDEGDNLAWRNLNIWCTETVDFDHIREPLRGRHLRAAHLALHPDDTGGEDDD